MMPAQPTLAAAAGLADASFAMFRGCCGHPRRITNADLRPNSCSPANDDPAFYQWLLAQHQLLPTIEDKQ